MLYQLKNHDFVNVSRFEAALIRESRHFETFCDLIKYFIAYAGEKNIDLSKIAQIDSRVLEQEL